MSQITIEHNPSEERLKELGVARWSIWEKEVSKFPIDFDEKETAYVLEGEMCPRYVESQGSRRSTSTPAVPGRAASSRR